MRNFIFLVSFLVSSSLLAQIPQLQRQEFPTGNQQQSRGQGSNNNLKDFERPPVTDYKIISIANDTTFVDTTLSIEKEYKFNYLRRDRYKLLPFSNTAQTNNTLIYDFDKQSTMPLSMAQSRHFNYMGVDDIYYYHVPTPLTELYYKTAFEQGQQLDAFFTMNTSPRLNFSIAYKGVRSLGKYQNILTSTGNFRSALSYRTKNDRYHLRAHWVAQDLLNNENGGLTDQSIDQFRSEIDEFDDRSRLSVQFEDAENILDGTRVYLNHFYKLLHRKDSIRTYSLDIGHVFNSENKFYEFRQGTARADLFGEAFEQNDFRDRTDHEETYNEVFLRYQDRNLGALTFQTNITNYDYGYKSVLISDNDMDGNPERIPNRLQGAIVAAGGKYNHTFGPLSIKGNAQVNVSGDFEGYTLGASAIYDFTNDNSLRAEFISNSSPANYNHLLYQSNYINYNWYNLPVYENVKSNTLKAELELPKLVNVSATATSIDNYAYFGLAAEDALVNSFQAAESITYLQLNANRTFIVGKFGLNSTVTFQQTSGGDGILNVPEIVTRNSLYFTDRVFKNALFLQTGLHLKYFTSYNLNGYDPVLAEFYTQNSEEFGDFPLLDFFINIKVRQTRIFVKAEHFNSSFTGNNFFSAPGYPYRDFNIRFGLVWNFFL